LQEAVCHIAKEDGGCAIFRELILQHRNGDGVSKNALGIPNQSKNAERGKHSEPPTGQGVWSAVLKNCRKENQHLDHPKSGGHALPAHLGEGQGLHDNKRAKHKAHQSPPNGRNPLAPE
jgi:hypothetical protein